MFQIKGVLEYSLYRFRFYVQDRYKEVIRYPSTQPNSTQLNPTQPNPTQINPNQLKSNHSNHDNFN